MLDTILVGIIVVIGGAVILFLRREKKRGVTCVGCPHARECAIRKSGQDCSGGDKV